MQARKSSTSNSAPQPTPLSARRTPRATALPASVFPPALRDGYVCIDPPQGHQPCNVLLLLHGAGDTPAPYAALARTMALPNTLAVALAGPLPLPETSGGRLWFHIFDDEYNLLPPRAHEPRRVASLTAATAAVEALVEALHTHGWDYSHIHLLGASASFGMDHAASLHAFARVTQHRNANSMLSRKAGEVVSRLLQRRDSGAGGGAAVSRRPTAGRCGLHLRQPAARDTDGG